MVATTPEGAVLAPQPRTLPSAVPAIGLLALLAGLVVVALPDSAPAVLAEQPAIDTGATAWMLVSTALVLLMIPGLAMFYGGLVRTKNVLGTMMHSFAAMAIVGVIWVIVGYALAFGPSALGGPVGWDPGLVFLRSIDGTVDANGVPTLVFAMFQGKFAIITPALIAGAFAERVRFRGYAVFIALWSILVYSPLATGSGRPTAGCSSWAPSTSRAAPSCTSRPASAPSSPRSTSAPAAATRGPRCTRRTWSWC